jgi:membrane peptidoglycan carboxypeptidase
MFTARRMGITSPLQPYPSLALGVFPVSPMEMATAYATLANGGFRVTPYTVSEIRDAREGSVRRNQARTERAVSPQIAFQMTDLLTSVLAPNGTGYPVHGYLHGQAAAKTGTTNTDAWMVGFTPNTVCAVWVGYDDNRPLSTAEAHLAAPIWAKFMGTAQLRNKSEWFTPPRGLIARAIDPASGLLATDTCGTTETDYFISGTEPVQPCPLHPATKHEPRKHNWLFGWLSKWL